MSDSYQSKRLGKNNSVYDMLLALGTIRLTEPTKGMRKFKVVDGDLQNQYLF